MLPLIHGHASLFTKLIAEFLDIPSGLKLAHLRMVQQKASCIEEHFEKLDKKLLKRKHDMDTERDNIYCECCIVFISDIYSMYHDILCIVYKSLWDFWKRYFRRHWECIVLFD